MGKKRTLFLLSLLAILCLQAYAFDRVPKPEFQTDYETPTLTTPSPRSIVFEYVDVGVFILFQGAAVYFAIKLRRRSYLAWLSAASVAYFGFIRRGCVCPVGATQNVILALFQPEYIIPLSVILLFAIPVIVTLFYGRTFCASVCPLGALQDLVIYKPVAVPVWITRILRCLPVLYLGFAALFAATGSDFIICRYDPFVGFFRFGGNFEMLLLGGFFLIIGLFIARPYCRFLCPYGLLLSWVSRLSHKHVTITPDSCIQCRLCETACPVDAINFPTQSVSSESRKAEERRVRLALFAVPLLIGVGVILGFSVHLPLASAHPTVTTAKRVFLEEKNLVTGMTLRSETFRASETTQDELFSKADNIIGQYKVGAPILGGLLGLGMGIAVIGLLRRRRRTDYEPDRGHCVSCGRCFAYCPREHLRRNTNERVPETVE